MLASAGLASERSFSSFTRLPVNTISRMALLMTHVGEAVNVAHSVGIERVSVSDIFVHWPELPAKVLSVETSPPKARAFIEKFLASEAFAKVPCTLTSRELRAVLSDVPPADLTEPMSEPFPDVIQDLSQLSTLMASYDGRAAGGGRYFSPAA
jgi:hypothetical protein